MSRTARNFLILRTWCDWQEEISARGGRAHPAFAEQEARLRREADFLIGYFA